MCAFAEFDGGGTGEETFDVEGREGEEVGFIEFGKVEEGVAGLGDVDGVGEGGFGRGVAG